MPDKTAQDGLEPDGDQPKPTTRGASKASGLFGKRFVLMALLCLAAMVAVAFFAPELKGFVVLRPWSKAPPAKAVDEFAAAVRSGDAASADALAPGVELSEDCTMIKSPAKSPRHPMQPIEDLLPAGPAAEGRLDYVFAFSELDLILPAASGSNITYTLTRDKGAWRIVRFQPTWEPRDP